MQIPNFLTAMFLLQIHRSDSSSPRRRSSANLNTLGRRSSSLTPNNIAGANNNNNINYNNKATIGLLQQTPNSRSSSSQQLQLNRNVAARNFNNKQTSANLLLQTAQANSTSSLISPQTKLTAAAAAAMNKTMVCAI
jgi:hypothetical protein